MEPGASCTQHDQCGWEGSDPSTGLQFSRTRYAAAPGSVVSDLFTSLCERHPRLEKRLLIDRTYALGAGCLLRLMDESEKAFWLSENQADKPVSLKRFGTMEGIECRPR